MNQITYAPIKNNKISLNKSRVQSKSKNMKYGRVFINFFGMEELC
jgi:hypothetical protein